MITTTSTTRDANAPHITWDPPGPGTWEFDAAHQQRPYPAAMLDWATRRGRGRFPCRVRDDRRSRSSGWRSDQSTGGSTCTPFRWADPTPAAPPPQVRALGSVPGRAGAPTTPCDGAIGVRRSAVERTGERVADNRPRCGADPTRRAGRRRPGGVHERCAGVTPRGSPRCGGRRLPGPLHPRRAGSGHHRPLRHQNERAHRATHRRRLRDAVRILPRNHRTVRASRPPRRRDPGRPGSRRRSTGRAVDHRRAGRATPRPHCRRTSTGTATPSSAGRVPSTRRSASSQV